MSGDRNLRQALDRPQLVGPLDPSSPAGALGEGLLSGEDGERLAKPDGLIGNTLLLRPWATDP